MDIKLENGIFDYNIGIDCEDVERWRKMLPGLEQGIQRKLFSEEEHCYCRSFSDPAPHYAARWCAKEAVLKALAPFCKIDMRTIEIVNDDEGRPFCRFSDPEIPRVKTIIKISLSHSKEVAMAVALVFVSEFQ
jgi:holo-[acyl-carrier protein] synthase